MKYAELLKTERPCPFDNPNPNEVIMENETAYLTFTIAGYHPDQLLVIPKRHITHLDQLTAQEQKDCDDLQQKGWHMLRHIGHGGANFLLREGQASGKTVKHLHYNIIPDTRLGDMDAHGVEVRDVMTESEIAATIERLRQAKARLVSQ